MAEFTIVLSDAELKVVTKQLEAHKKESVKDLLLHALEGLKECPEDPKPIKK